MDENSQLYEVLAINRRHPLKVYPDLSPEQGHEAALWALSLIAGGSERELGLEVVLYLSYLVPGSLTGLYNTLVNQRCFKAPVIYRDADASIRELLLDLLPSQLAADLVPDIVEALAWMADDTVRRLFRGWAINAPEWLHSRWNQPIAAWLASCAAKAGWSMEDDARIPSLYKHECRVLTPLSERTFPEEAQVVRVISPHDGACEWCGQPMVTLFDFDLRSPDLSFLGLSGESLRIAMCWACVSYSDAFFTRIDAQGGSSRHSLNNKPENTVPVNELKYLPERQLVLGERLRTPFHFFGWNWDGASQLGGYPCWEQHADVPACPDCGRKMLFVGQVSPGQLLPSQEGKLYGFVCTGCQVAATVYQNT